MPSKTISFSLDAGSVERAIREVEKFTDELRSKMNELARRLTDEGKAIAEVRVVAHGAFQSAELLSSIDGYYDENTHTGIVMAGAPHAFFVEYGTGIVGAGNAHPEVTGDWNPGAVGNYTKYDTNGHGQAGWWYKSPYGWYIPKNGDGSAYAWTKGMPSRPFMYETFKQLERLSVDIYNELFSK